MTEGKPNPFWMTPRKSSKTAKILVRPERRDPTRFSNQEFGKLLREYRMNVDISQAELARRAKIDHSYVSRIESGKQQPSRDILIRISESLGFSENDVRLDRMFALCGLTREEPTRVLFACEEIMNLDSLYLNSSPIVQAAVRSTLNLLIEGLKSLSKRTGPV